MPWVISRTFGCTGLMILSAFYFFPVDDVIAFVKFINVTYPLKTFKCKHFKHKLGLGS